MQRIIKFRAWGGASKKMIYPDRELTSGEILDRAVNIMQFTGLLDKNGKEIYEGDVLEILPEFADEGQKYTAIIRWDNDSCKFWADDNGGSWDSHVWNKHKIIGNIYENPEILK